MNTTEMSAILINYLSGKPVSESDLTEANTLFEQHGGGNRLIQLTKLLGQRAAELQLPQSDNVVDLGRIRLRKSQGTLAISQGDAQPLAAGWMSQDQTNVKLNLELPEQPDNQIDLLIENGPDTAYVLNVLAIRGPNRNQCTLSIESKDTSSVIDAGLTRRLEIDAGVHQLTIRFGEDGSVTIELDLS